MYQDFMAIVNFFLAYPHLFFALVSFVLMLISSAKRSFALYIFLGTFILSLVFFVFEGTIYKFGTNEIVEKAQFLSFSLFQATHLMADYVYDEDSKFTYPVEIG